jgi:hypothetical protein
VTHEALLISPLASKQAKIVMCICVRRIELEATRVAQLRVIQTPDVFQSYSPVEVQHLVFREMSERLLEDL